MKRNPESWICRKSRLEAFGRKWWLSGFKQKASWSNGFWWRCCNLKRMVTLRGMAWFAEEKSLELQEKKILKTGGPKVKWGDHGTNAAWLVLQVRIYRSSFSTPAAFGYPLGWSKGHFLLSRWDDVTSGTTPKTKLFCGLHLPPIPIVVSNSCEICTQNISWLGLLSKKINFP